MSTGLDRVRDLAMSDRSFRDRLLADPESAVRNARLTLTREEMTTLQKEIDRLRTSKTVGELDKIFRTGALGW